MILPRPSDLELNIVAELGRVTITLEDMLEWEKNIEVPLDIHENSEVILSVGKNKIASGDLQLKDEKLYVRITSLCLFK